MKHRLLDRIQDRAWSEVGRWLACPPEPASTVSGGANASSVSGTMPWVSVCSDLAEGRRSSRNFRRLSAVRDIVETVGASEGRFYAARASEWGSEWLRDETLARIDSWGDPIRWPALLLGTARPFSPTTLRYLATALWLRRNGHLEKGSSLVEIGVGFGGLAAMNALVSGTTTTLVDLPEVAAAAMQMLDENGFPHSARLPVEDDEAPIPLVISNYAYTELNVPLQEEYFERYLRRARHGIIISNSAVFAERIQGKTDDELVGWFRAEGLDARLETSNDLLGPGDHLSAVTMIRW